MFKENSLLQIKSMSLLFLITCLTTSCGTNSDNNSKLNLVGEWELIGLERAEINNINSAFHPMLFSTNKGLYIKQNKLELFGLSEKEIVDVTILNNGNYLVATQASDFANGDTTLYLKANNEDSWQGFLNNYGGEENRYTWVSNLLSVGEENILASGGSNIAKSTNMGANWKSVYYDWGYIGFTNFMKSDAKNSDIIWAGGENAIFEPTLVRSVDGGEIWERLIILENVEAANNDLISNPKKNKQIMVGLSGIGSTANIIRRSLDNGRTWNTVLQDIATYTFAGSVQNPNVVYASGRNSTGTLFFLASGDFGDTWQTIEFEDSPGEIHVNDMVSVMEDGEEVLYLGTNKGVYSYTFEK